MRIVDKVRLYNEKIEALANLGMPKAQLPQPIQSLTGFSKPDIAKLHSKIDRFMNTRHVKFGAALVDEATSKKFIAKQKAVNDLENKMFRERMRNMNKITTSISEQKQGIRDKHTVADFRRPPRMPYRYSKREFKSNADFEQYFEHMDKRIRNIKNQSTLFRENMMKALKHVNADAMDDILAALEELNADDFDYMYQNYAEFNLQYIYEWLNSGIDYADEEVAETFSMIVEDYLRVLNGGESMYGTDEEE